MQPPASALTLHRLAIAKEMYLQGETNGNMKSRVNLISAILNFDYAVETALKAVALDNDISLYRESKKTWGSKSFPELVHDILDKKPLSKVIVDQISGLHDLRNNVQHSTLIPSLEEVDKHRHTVRLFFDDVCTVFYNNSINFDSVSLAYLVDNQIERIILDEMEKSISELRYPDAITYARVSLRYHIDLLKKQLGMPSALLHNLDSYQEITRTLGSPARPGRHIQNTVGDRYFRSIKEAIKWIINKLILHDYESEVKRLLSAHYDFTSTDNSYNADEAERVRALTYNVITRSQSQPGIDD